MVISSTKVNLDGIDLEKIKLEAELTSTPMSKILKDYALEYLKLKNETEGAHSGEALEGSVIHTIISKMEFRIAKALEQNSKEMGDLKLEMQIIAAIIDNFVKLYLNHTPEVAIEDREERIKLSLARYQRFLSAVKYALKDGNANIITQVQELIMKELEENTQ
jgi:hypothetical protein